MRACVCVHVCMCVNTPKNGVSWHRTGHSGELWLISAAAENWNEQMEESEWTCKDDRKQRRKKVADEWAWSEPGCAFLAQSKTELMNHTRQVHTIQCCPESIDMSSMQAML